jgi:hypothetical protein
MNTFDKICACLAVALGAVFILRGLAGLFIGWKINFTFSPILGGIPALVGWGIIKPVIIAWKKPPDSSPAAAALEPTAPSPVEGDQK